MGGRADIRAEMAAAISNAIIDHGSDAGAGETTIDPDQARQALVTSLAMWIEADPRAQGHRGLRDMTELAVRELKTQTRHVRMRFVETGERAWDARPVILS
jgi:hypothetical protein